MDTKGYETRVINTYATTNFERDLQRLLAPEKETGLALCKGALLDIFFGGETDIESRRWSVRYHRRGALRAYFDRSRGKLNGEFLVFYPDGKTWMKGGCKNDELISSSLKLYLPDGRIAQSASRNSNVIPIFSRRPKK